MAEAEDVTEEDFDLEDSIDEEVVESVDHEDGSSEMKLTRREKRGSRAGRFKAMEELAEQQREEIRSLRDRQASFERDAIDEAAQLRHMRDEPKESETERLNRERSEYHKQWQGLSAEQQRDPDTAARYTKLGQDNETARMRLAAQEVVAANTQNATVAANRAAMNAEFPDVMGAAGATEWAQGYYAQQKAKGRDANMELTREAFQAAREEFKTGGRSSGAGRPSASEQARYAGEGKGAAAPRGAKKTSGVMSRVDKDMAEALYPDLPDRQAHQKWFNSVGKKRLARGE